MNKKPTITAHMIIKNDDQWVWYAIKSVLPYVDTFLITDTGSTDHTIDYIKTFNDPKIVFAKHPVSSAREVVEVRKMQLKNTTADWLWMVDGDEVYSDALCREIVENLHSDLAGIVVRRRDCLGDIYHYQPDEFVGGYHMFGTTAHYSLRLLNMHVHNLHLAGEYPNEGFYDAENTAILDYPKHKFYITKRRYLHATYLARSSRGGNLTDTIHRMKYKVELGKKVPSHELPEVFTLPRPSIVPAPIKRSFLYQAQAIVVTPLKNLKRKLVR